MTRVSALAVALAFILLLVVARFMYLIVTSRRWNIILGQISWPSRYGVCVRYRHIKITNPSGLPPLYVVYHIGTVNNYRKVVEEQMAELQTSGLYDLCEAILVGANGPGCRSFTRELQDRFAKVRLLDHAIVEYPKTYERCTLNAMIQFARQKTTSRNALFCYIHSKGVTETAVAQPSWRRFMMYWVVRQHEMHRRLLSGNPNLLTSGVFLAAAPTWMYSGNFFWAKSSYVRTWDRLTGQSIFGRLEDELLCLRKALPRRHIVLVPQDTHRLFHFCSYHDEEPIVPDENPWVAFIPYSREGIFSDTIHGSSGENKTHLSGPSRCKRFNMDSAWRELEATSGNTITS